ncbi:MAG: hypothetical protein JEZ04_17310 [Spirochaetales bacterium]|nr:hypothetical protein [Spirochaetales bacterium]
MKKSLIILVIVLAAAVLFSCTAGPNTLEQTKMVEDKPAGFLLGLWHGFISLFTFIISLFTDKVNLYEVYNNGGWYNFGFIIGVSIFFGGGGKGTSRKRRRD